MEKIELLQQVMNEKGYDAYIIPTSDYHNSEYVSDFFKARAYLSGFNGSAGTLLVTKENAYLWVDGRYFIQAEKQIEGKHITLMKMGNPGTPTLEEFLNQNLKDNEVLGFDGKVMNTNLVNGIIKAVSAKIRLKTEDDLVNAVWPDRPALPYSLLYILDIMFSGKAYSDKVADVREAMKKEGADLHIITSLEDIAWLYNLRGDDVTHTPVFLSYAVISATDSLLFVDKKKLNEEVKKYLKDNDVTVKDYSDIEKYCEGLKNKNILIDLSKANYRIYSIIKDSNTIINKLNPTLLMKSIKNETEIKNSIDVHARDGAMVTKLMYHVKKGYENKEDISELSEGNYVDNLRREQKGCVDLSFGTIAAFADHGAMMHYSATEESNYKIDKPGFFLVDSGGHYLEGTTDITRTFSVGKITDEMKVHYTTVLKSNIDLAMAVFMEGCNGQNLDILARGPVWRLLIDYKCGTGHGVGNLLSVHEGPNGFRWRIVPERMDSAVFVPGMITTDEPGIYLENKYGIRLENELLCVEMGKSEFGNFLGFETITYCPFDLDCIKVALLTKDEKQWLNDYHELVYKKVNRYMTKEEKVWLQNATRKI